MKAILNDVTRCTGCEECVRACVSEHGLKPPLPAKRSSADRLSARRWCSVAAISDGGYARESCYHCLRPACVEACLVGAITKTAMGPVIYDADKCIGCRYCMLACPFGIPRYEWEQTQPFIRKCTMCSDRVADGRRPACVEACPHGAMLFGEREALLAEARQRIQAQPNLYVPHIYGEDEVGGTCVLYISHVRLEDLGWPRVVGSKPLPEYTWPVISKTPIIGLTVASGLSAVTWIVHRRMKIAREHSNEAVDHPPRESSP